MESNCDRGGVKTQTQLFNEYFLRAAKPCTRPAGVVKLPLVDMARMRFAKELDLELVSDSQLRRWNDKEGSPTGCDDFPGAS